jgi:hypothetical protein
MLLALVPAGILNQSIQPKGAASKPPMIPAAIMYAAATAKPPRSVMRYTMSKTTAVARSGNGISMGWIA